MNQRYLSKVSEAIEGMVTEKLSKEFSGMVSRISGASCKLDDILLNPQVQTCSAAVPATSRISGSEKREPLGIVF